jgi:hypothetical protein
MEELAERLENIRLQKAKTEVIIKFIKENKCITASGSESHQLLAA